MKLVIYTPSDSYLKRIDKKVGGGSGTRADRCRGADIMGHYGAQVTPLTPFRLLRQMVPPLALLSDSSL